MERWHLVFINKLFPIIYGLPLIVDDEQRRWNGDSLGMPGVQRGDYEHELMRFPFPSFQMTFEHVPEAVFHVHI